MGNNVVITGISSGVGEALTKKFLTLGYNVFGLVRNLTKTYDVFGDVNGLTVIECDVSDSESVINAFKQIDNIDILINNASVFVSSNFTETTQVDINTVLDTNLKGTINCTLQSLDKMESGRIINIGSVSGTHGIKNQAIYSSSKHGLIGFSNSLAQELEKINITTICPGGINTPLWSKDNEYDGDVNDLLSTKDIVDTVLFITNLSDSVVVKEIIMFPKCEWH